MEIVENYESPKLECVDTMKGIVFDLKCISKLQMENLMHSLTWKKRMQNGKRVVIIQTEFYKIYELPDKKLFAIARHAFHQNFKNFQQHIPEFHLTYKVPKGKDVTYTTTIKLEPPQKAVCDYLVEYFKSGPQKPNGCVFVMDAGLGKSFVASKIIERLQKKTLLVVMNTNQLQQWKADVFGKYFSGVTIGEYSAKKKADGDIVIVIIKSLIKLEQNYLKEFGLVIFDEIPEFMGPSYREAFWKTNTQYVLGLTATPDERLDGMDIFYKQLVGPLVRATDIEGFNVEQIIWKGRVKTIRYTGPPQFTKTLTSVTNEMSCTMMNQQFSQDPYRCQLIYNYIVELYNAGKNVYIFATNRDHLDNMCNIIRKSNIDFTIEDEEVPSEPEEDKVRLGAITKVKTLMGGVSDAEVVEAKKKSRIIFTTYSYGAVGMSIIKMDAIIFMTSRKNKMRQILGRILRRGGDPSIVRDIIDIVDYSTGIKSQYYKRKKIYEEKDFPIEVIDIDYSSITLKNFTL